MALHAVTVPKWGLSMDEGAVVEWHRAEGDEVSAGDELVEVETSKIANVVESPRGGHLVRIVAGPGETLPVGGLLGVLADASGADDAAIDAFIAEFNAHLVASAGDEAAIDGGQRTVDVEGKTVNYLVAGNGDATPVVFVHGFGGDANGWLFNIDAATADGRRAYALDLPGHGQSGQSVGDGSLEHFRTVLEGFLDALSLARVHLVGHSMGGAVALALAEREPDRVATLTLVAPAGLAERINRDYLDGFVAARTRRELKPVLTELFADPKLVSRDMINDILRYKRVDGVAESLGRIAEAMFPQGRQAFSLRGALDSVAVPALVVWGEDDRIAKPAAADGLAAAVRVERLAGMGHMPHLEAASRFNALLGEHLHQAAR